uniref:Regulatory inactivation of DnaA Hda protein n=1 Tax=Candidatus Kentrum sp. LPFa TaxID=2126335 RepID=A0A450W8N4_9GAMM|nr:MAG: regulatory inactivation of DnaA Hda protein [Candidatus Kentron sp. LPFa]VFK29425.1 MAG: regulatory inactivation of DnaA Hda protein [Candidatus Kentron sp. LPFa]
MDTGSFESYPKQIPLPFDTRSEPSLTNFIVGPNREAQEAVSGVATGRGERVVYLWGEKGTGKSHLLAAVHRDVVRQKRNVAFLSCRSPDALQENIANSPGVDLICIDDIDRQAGNRDREEILFHLYNQAEVGGTDLLIAGQRNPLGAGFSLPDLGSRLSAGLVLRLHPLDDDGRRMALERRAREWGFTLSDRVITFLLYRCQRDMHSLFSLLEKIDQATLVEKRRVTIPFVRDLLASFP